MSTRSLAFAVALILSTFCSTVLGESQETYSKPEFGYQVELPSDWTVFREYQDEDEAIVSFGLPLVWSELEQQEIENAVAVAAYRREEIKSLQEMVDFEHDRIQDFLVSSTEVEAESGRTFRQVSEIRGLEYRSLANIRYVNGVGYVFTFTATEGTYEKNLPLFQAFLSTLTFKEPTAVQAPEPRTRVEKALELYSLGPSKAPEIIAILQEELEENPENIKAIKLLGITYFDTDSFADALACFERGIELAEKEGSIQPHLLLLKARTLHRLDRNQEALKILEVYWAFFQGDPDLEKQAEELASRSKD
jgi:tetratricopeptide (TPR) repeat protein